MAEPLALLLRVCLFAFLARFLLEAHGADRRQPLAAALARVTDPVYQPLRRALGRRVDWRAPLLLIALLLELASLHLHGAFGHASPLGAALYAAARLGADLLTLYLICLLLTVVASWVQLSAAAQSYLELVRCVTAPLLARIRAFLPAAGPLDFSPMIALFGVYFAQTALARLGVWALGA